MGNAYVGQKPLEYLLCTMTLKRGWLMVLKVLTPKGVDPFAGSDLRLILQRQRLILCTHVDCRAAFLEFKELLRHVRTVHACRLVCKEFIHAMSLAATEVLPQEAGWRLT
jgi:hypothetical protein